MKQVIFGIAYLYFAGSYYVHDGFFNSLFWLVLFVLNIVVSWHRAIDFGGVGNFIVDLLVGRISPVGKYLGTLLVVLGYFYHDDQDPYGLIYREESMGFFDWVGLLLYLTWIVFTLKKMAETSQKG